MAKINILSVEICNRIAAGEVIDRPYSVVKELVENSLDAGATEIEISIQRGGKDLIKVVDNGCGIEEDDMRSAFFAHATSKIATIDDIDRISTLGFRGEALATIASVAEVELVSITEGGEAHKVECDGDYIGKVQPAVFDKGTQITVRNLFFNTPVRAKFLKSDKKEESDVTNFITRYILCNPNVAFKYFVDGKLSLQSYGSGLEDAITQVYGPQVLSKCYKIAADRNDIKISGFIGNQNFSKPNKTYQSVFLNGRYIVNQVIASAIANAYSPYLMKKQYPFYVLFIDVPQGSVDVNVHPNKADVRFVDNTVVYGSVYKVISSVLDGTTKAADFLVDSGEAQEETPKSNDSFTAQKPYAAEFTQTEKVYDTTFSDIAGMPDFSKNKGNIKAKETENGENKEPSPYENYEEPKIFDAEKEVPLYKFYAPQQEKFTLSVCGGSNTKSRSQYEAEKEIEKYRQQAIEFRSCKYKGSLFNTYLLYEIEDEVYIIDQHAAHERLLFDKFSEKYHNRESIAKQGMIIPYILNVNANERDFIENNIMLIRKMGFSVEPFGVFSYRVNAVPCDLKDINLKFFFDELLSDVKNLKEIKVEDVLRDKIATAACRHAIKGGMELTEEERKTLFEMLEGDMGLKCPHGRPICVKLTLRQIEKMFKRIV